MSAEVADECSEVPSGLKEDVSSINKLNELSKFQCFVHQRYNAAKCPRLFQILSVMIA